MIFEQEFKIGLDDLNRDVELKNVSLLRLLEDIAGFHSDSIGMGINENFGSGTAWALLDWEVKVQRRPRYGEDLKLLTWSRLIQRCHAYRDFEVYAGGEKCAIATTKWMMLDLKKRWPMIIKKDVAAKYGPEPERNVFGIEELPRLTEFTGGELAAEYKVRRSDIDINGHVHNLNYLEIVQDALTEEETVDTDRFRINFRKEIRYGDTVKIFRQEEAPSSPDAKNGKKITFLIKNEDCSEVHAIVELE